MSLVGYSYINRYNYLPIQCVCLRDTFITLQLFLSHIVRVAMHCSISCNNERSFVCVDVKEAAQVTVTSIKWENCEDALELYGSHGLSAY